MGTKPVASLLKGLQQSAYTILVGYQKSMASAYHYRGLTSGQIISVSELYEILPEAIECVGLVADEPDLTTVQAVAAKAIIGGNDYQQGWVTLLHWAESSEISGRLRQWCADCKLQVARVVDKSRGVVSPHTIRQLATMQDRYDVFTEAAAVAGGHMNLHTLTFKGGAAMERYIAEVVAKRDGMSDYSRTAWQKVSFLVSPYVSLDANLQEYLK